MTTKKPPPAINTPAPEWLIAAMDEVSCWTDTPGVSVADIVWDAIKSQGLYPNGIGGSKRYSTIPVVVIPVEVEPA